MPAWVGIVCFIAAAVWLALLFVRAPRGYEDERGFHYGVRPKASRKPLLPSTQDSADVGANPDQPDARLEPTDTRLK